jgi:hypothetical protein
MDGNLNAPEGLGTHGASDVENRDDAGSSTADDWAAPGGGWETSSLSWALEPTPGPSSTTLEVKLKPISRTTDQLNQDKPPRNAGGVSSQDPPLSVFDPLIQILRGADNGMMKRSQLGEHLAKQKDLYQSAGVGTFSEFIAIAIRKNLVTLRGTDGHQQVKLKKRR